MVGLVLSDTFLLTASWEDSGGVKSAAGVIKIPFTEPISSLLHNEAELNAILASALRQAKEANSFEGQNIYVGLPDSFVEHSIVPVEQDLSSDDHINYIQWVESQKNRTKEQSVYLFGQVYFPAEENIHVCGVPRALVRTLKLSISELGGVPHWMGPVSSMYLDGSGMSEAAMIHRRGNKYSFMKVQDNVFGMGTVTFSGGIAKVASTTDASEEITLAALGLERSDLDDIPIFCPQKLGRQAKSAWELSDFRLSVPFDGVEVDGINTEKLPYYEANILTQLINDIALEHSFNLFGEPGVTDFFFTKVIPELDEIENGEESVEESIEDDEPEVMDADIVQEKKPTSITGFGLSILLIVGAFIGFNYLKLQDQLNNPFFGVNKDFVIKRSGIDDTTTIKTAPKIPPVNLIKQSRAISSSIITLFTETDLNRYNALTITKSFLSLEYLSGVNPNIENILGIEPTSFSVEATGRDSTIFLWYYSFELPLMDGTPAPGELSKIDLMVQMDTTLTDYSLKYFEQVFTKNQIYGPLLIWVRGKADILQASALISNINDSILLRKFVLFNQSDNPNPRAGFYVSILED
ncbi:MAG: hypothetical protein QF780_01205 [Candidatus Marinimicrobia bacterium]|jgi:hypothetical protein|nr:hypothetical protein [Candidatus Neomarinimicrobiota bacterium]|tara:strand:- start:93 stop:1832 length:1740 start_codon:yes stop_codon:yes gene_type:complete